MAESDNLGDYRLNNAPLTMLAKPTGFCENLFWSQATGLKVKSIQTQNDTFDPQGANTGREVSGTYKIPTCPSAEKNKKQQMFSRSPASGKELEKKNFYKK